LGGDELYKNRDQRLISKQYKAALPSMVIVPLEPRVPVANLSFELTRSSVPLKLGSQEGVQPFYLGLASVPILI